MKRHANENLRTKFAGTGRFAGTGLVEEDYSEESFPDYVRDGTEYWWSAPRKKEEAQPVTVYKMSEEELARYRQKKPCSSICTSKPRKQGTTHPK